MKPSKISLNHKLLQKTTSTTTNRSWLDHIKGLFFRCFYAAKNPKTGIPRDVPKGHVAVYVGEADLRARYVVDISVFGHPLFRALLDQAAEVFDYSTASKLRIPCSEAVFLGTLGLCGRSKKSGGCRGSCFSAYRTGSPVASS